MDGSWALFVSIHSKGSEMSELIDCDLCGKNFDPRNSEMDVVGGLYICCSSNYLPEELAEKLDISIDEVYRCLGLERT